MDDIQAYRELAERLLLDKHGSGGEGEQSLQLLVGRVPDDLPVQVPSGEGWRLVGSSVLTFAPPFPGVPEQRSYSVVLDTSFDRKEAARRLRKAWTAGGWQVEEWDFLPDPWRDSGFKSAGRIPGMPPK